MRRRSALVLLAAAGAGAAVVLFVDHGGRDIRGATSTEYVTTVHERQLPPLAPWPQWGRVPEKTRTEPRGPRPPYRLLWAYHAGSLLEFPPTLAAGRLFLSTFTGRLVALAPWNGRVLWRRDERQCAWAQPAVAHGLVFQTFLLRPPRCRAADGGGGSLAAFDVRTGALRWRVGMAPTESSPLVAAGRVVVGDWSGAVSAYAAATGRQLWRFHGDGAVKSSAALAGDRLYVATYGGSVYALRVRDGGIVWHTRPGRFWHRPSFYSTPAIAHGRIYLGGLDGRVYALGARSGKVLWATATGGYVYGSPAVWHDLVLVGSYDGRFYALDAGTGAPRWIFASGPVSGSATVVAGAVYLSTLRERTFAVAARSGRRLWSFPDGKYCAGVADRRRFYLVGANRIFALTGTPRSTSK